MIEIAIASCLVGVLAGAIMSPLLHKWLTKKLVKKISLGKSSFLRIYLPNGLKMTVWDSTINKGEICACVHQANDTKVADGDIVYFTGNLVSRIRGNNFHYDRQI